MRALAEQLKVPLMQIARHAELGQVQSDAEQMLRITHIADMSLRLLDGFLLDGVLRDSESLKLEPVSISSAFVDVAHRLSPLAREYDCDLQVSLGGRYAPAMAHPASLHTALVMLGYSLLSARRRDDARHEVTFGAHRTTHGIVVGVFDNQGGFTADVLRRGRALYGSARQALPAVSGANGAGIFLADALLSRMASPLRVARHQNVTGLATTVYPSAQLRLV